MSTPFSFGTRILAGGAALLGLVLAVGFFLPGTWSAERAVLVEAHSDALYRWIDAPEAWRRWTPWPDSGLVAEGPARGVGARLSWDDLELGDGSFEIVHARPGAEIGYEVLVQGGSMRTRGTVRLETDPEGTRVTWREEGDFGRNPLMGYWARSMGRAQGAELEKGLARLKDLAESGTLPPGT